MQTQKSRRCSELRETTQELESSSPVQRSTHLVIQEASATAQT